MISIIIVAYNEEQEMERILKNLKSLPAKRSVEIILADGGSTDQTLELATPFATIVNAPKGKAIQMNQAAKEAKGDILFFVHADMQLPPETLLALEQRIDEAGLDGGGFANVFDRYNQRIKCLGTYLNLRFLDTREQSDRNIFYGDNGIFVRKEVFEALGGFKEIPIMEDYDFSIRLKQAYKVGRIKTPKLILSARRHQKAGFLKTRIQWIVIKKLYLLGFPPEWLAAWYKDVR